MFSRKTLLIVTACVSFLVACASKKQAVVKASIKPEKTNEVIVVPALSAVGRVAYVNRASRFAVLEYPIGSEPVLRQKLNVYRNKLKVAELTVTGPRNEGNIVADITAGEVQAGDETRED